MEVRVHLAPDLVNGRFGPRPERHDRREFDGGHAHRGGVL
jgi:hypothetical protein